MEIFVLVKTHFDSRETGCSPMSEGMIVLEAIRAEVEAIKAVAKC